MAKIKADMHVHIPNNTTKEEFIKYLQKAEMNKVKKLCLLQYDKYDNIDIVEELLKNDEIKKYYNGQLFIGVESSSMLDANHINPDGSNYDGYTIHLLVYSSIQDAKKLRKRKIIGNRNTRLDYKKDYRCLMKILKNIIKEKNISVELPTINNLKEKQKPHIIKDFQAWIFENDERGSKYQKILNVDDSFKIDASKFIRKLHQTPGEVLFFKSFSIPKTSKLLSKIKKVTPNSKIVVAHPAYMSDYFDTKYYLDSLMSISKKTTQNIFYAIESNYYKNTIEEHKMLSKYAKEHNLLESAGSDAKTCTEEKTMQFKNRNCPQIHLHKSTYGEAIGIAYDKGKIKTYKKDGKTYLDYEPKCGTMLIDSSFCEDLSIK